MTKTIPNYLRIHRGPAKAASATVPTGENVETFWDAYREATGWRIDQRTAGPKSPMQLLPAAIDPMSGVDTESLPPVSHQRAMRLAESATMLAEQLGEAREALRRQEAELAARASIVVESHSQARLADQIELTLADAVAACRCDAAAMYLLDDDTKYLKARSVYRLDPQRLEVPPRELRGSRADLEALVQGVVTIDDFQFGSIDTWNSPEPFASGICVAIKQDDVPIGTLWLFGNEVKKFGKAEAAAARMAGSQLAYHLLHAASGKQRQVHKEEAAVIRDISHWQYQGLPVGVALAEGWRVDGMIESPKDWSTGWHSWDVLPDGSLLLAMAEAVDPTITGALSATVARAALTAHTGYRHTPRQMMQRIHDTLWQTSTGEQLMSLLYARIDPESGEGEVASAGNISAFIANRFGYRPLVDGRGEPLTTSIEPRCVAETFRMMPGESLLAYGDGFNGEGVDQMLLGNSMRDAMKRSEVNPLARLRRQLAKHRLTSERGVVALVREPADN